MLSKRAEILKPSALQEFFRRTKTIPGVISLAVGQADCPSPRFVKIAGIEAIEKDFTGYTPAAGISDLRKKAVEDFRENGISSATLENTIIGPGSKPLIAAVLWALCEPGDEVLIPGPYYPPYWDLVLNFGGEPVLVDTKEDGFMLKKERVQQSLSGKTTGIILNSPSNPTGMVWNWGELESLADKKIWFLLDEAYNRIVYDGNYLSFATFPGVKERAIVIRSCSKTFAMTGWRIGYLTGPQEIVEKIQLYLEAAVGCPCSISQKAAITAFENPNSQVSLSKMLENLNWRRIYLMEWLKERNIPFPLPRGAFYVFADFSRYGDSMSLANLFLEKAKVAVTPGTAFGPYDGYLRLSYASVSKQQLPEALDRIDRALKG